MSSIAADVMGDRSLTAAILARDEADLLDGCLTSVRWADELLVVVDDRTSDRTAEIARGYTDRVLECSFVGFPHQRNRALDLAGAEWVFFVDADERVTPALAAEVRRLVGDSHAASLDDRIAGAWVPRRNIIAGRWVRWAGWFPDRQLRLLRRGAARYDESALVHEVATLDGPSATLREPLLHLNYVSLAEFRAKQRRYAMLEARTLYAAGSRARRRALLGQPLRELGRRLFEQRGYRQGWLGATLAAEMARARLSTYRELRRIVDEEPAAYQPAAAPSLRGSAAAQ